MMNSAGRSLVSFRNGLLLRRSSGSSVLPPMWRREEVPEKRRQQQVRSFHATRRQEILPLVGAVIVIMGIRYSYKALKRMDEEWDEYQWQLQQYEKKHGKVGSYSSGGSPVLSTLGVDLGSFYLKLALSEGERKANILINRVGFRYTFNGILHPDSDTHLLGQAAFDKMYELKLTPKAQQVMLPYQDEKVIPNVVKPAVDEVLEAAMGSSNMDEVRPVVALPPQKMESMKNEFGFFINATIVPEPVAAIWGAELVGGFTDSGDPILVLDVGGQVATLAVIQKHKLLHHVVLPNVGGEVWSKVIVKYLLDHSDLPLDQDGMAMQRLYQAAHTATAEFNTNSQCHVQIPYISMDMKTRDPQHLDTNMSRSIVEQLVQQDLRDNSIPQLEKDQVLSSVMPVPNDFTSLFTSVLTQVLTDTALTPISVKVLVVGGGAKQTLVETSFRDAWMTLTGGVAGESLVVPELAVRSELVALGAASLSPHHEYNPEQGIVSSS